MVLNKKLPKPEGKGDGKNTGLKTGLGVGAWWSAMLRANVKQPVKKTDAELLAAAKKEFPKRPKFQPVGRIRSFYNRGVQGFGTAGKNLRGTKEESFHYADSKGTIAESSDWGNDRPKDKKLQKLAHERAMKQHAKKKKKAATKERTKEAAKEKRAAAKKAAPAKPAKKKAAPKKKAAVKLKVKKAEPKAA